MSSNFEESPAGEEKYPDTHYPYEQFEKDFYGFFDAMDAENEAFAEANGEEVELGFMRTSLFLKDYMETREPNALHRTRKALTIFLVSDYIFTHSKELDVGQHLVRGKMALLFSNHLVEAVFRLLLPQEIYRGMTNMPSPADVLAFADRLRRSEDGHEADAEGQA
jgi:hypothetical protein